MILKSYCPNDFYADGMKDVISMNRSGDRMDRMIC